jgi:hypothetical protein
MKFKKWLEEQGCTVEIVQEDDGGGYYCIEVWTPEMRPADVLGGDPGVNLTVTEQPGENAVR